MPDFDFTLRTQERIKRNVIIDSNNCWLWQRSKERKGYGRMTMHRPTGKRTNEMAHRVAYEMFVKQIPAGLQLDHLCRVTSCVNPAHLEPVTAKENLHRSSLKQRWAQAKQITHCPSGHEYSPKNTLVKKNKWGNGCRNCRKCHSEREMKRYYARKAVLA